MRYSIICLFLASCASMAQEPQYKIVDHDRVVIQRCTDRRPPAQDYAATDEKIAAVADHDFERLAKLYRADRDQRIARLAIDEVQIKGCEE